LLSTIIKIEDVRGEKNKESTGERKKERVKEEKEKINEESTEGKIRGS
jgi:hypothetical protein